MLGIRGTRRTRAIKAERNGERRAYTGHKQDKQRQDDYVNMQTLSRVREKFSGAREAIVVTIYPVFSSQPWSQVELPTKLNFTKNSKSRLCGAAIISGRKARAESPQDSMPDDFRTDKWWGNHVDSQHNALKQHREIQTVPGGRALQRTGGAQGVGPE
ncbi:hypothetical protein TcasGA2_TC014355 [Tribolium castaneum]|uniref:Uncharacterized protein n=1 Tax=Tribolium castaneum TaxID=7070 RepID=D6WLI1_TRICA|nr:hypothetical protein TcasGA2_TC014355 [Tribolium castaneum]